MKILEDKSRQAKKRVNGCAHIMAIMRAHPFTHFFSRRLDEKSTLQKVTERLYFTYLQGILHATKFNQNWHMGRDRRRNQSYQVW